MSKYLLLFFVIILFYLLKRENNKIEKFNSNYKPNNWNKLSFNDKLRLNALNLGEKDSIYADKYRVKKLLEKKKINNLKYAKVIKILNTNDNLNLQSLPKNCIIKTNNGWNDIIIVRNNKINQMIGRGKRVKDYNEWKKRSIISHKTKYENHYKYIEPVIFVEEYLGDNLTDYKFYCFHGKVELLFIANNRFKEYCYGCYDKDLRVSKYVIIDNINYKLCNNKIIGNDKKKLKEMMRIAEHLSSEFEFIRIDLYLIKDKIYFGEYTFTPFACTGQIYPKKYEKHFSELW